MLLVLGMLQPSKLCCAQCYCCGNCTVCCKHCGQNDVLALGVAICYLGCVELLDQGQLLHHVFKSQKAVLHDAKAFCVCQSMSITPALLLLSRATAILDSNKSS